MPPEAKYTLREFEAQLARRGLGVRRLGGPLAEAHAARKTKKATPSVFDLEPNLDIDNDLDDDDDVSAPLDDNDGGKEPASKGANIVVHWCDKPKGSPGRGASGYNLKKKLGMPDRSYRLVLSGVKLLLMRQPGIDMTATITFQDENILRHVLKKAAKQYPEFDIFAKQGRWPLRAFAHTILRTSANLYQQNSGQRQSKQKKGEAAVEDHLPAVDQSMRDGTGPLAGVPPPLQGDQLQPTDKSMRDGQPPVLDQSMRADDEPPFGMDPLLGDDPRLHILPKPNAEPPVEEPAIPPGVFDDDDDNIVQDCAVNAVLKDFGNVTLDSTGDEDGSAVGSVATYTTSPGHPGQDKSAPPTRKPGAMAPTRKSAPPTARVAEPTRVLASHQSTAKDPPARAPAQASAHKLPPPSSANVNSPASKPAPPVHASKPTPPPSLPAPTSDPDDEDFGITGEMLAKLEGMAKNPKYRAQIPATYKALVDKIFPVSDDAAASTAPVSTTTPASTLAATAPAATAPATTAPAATAPVTAAPKTKSGPKPRMRPPPEPEVPEPSESELSDAPSASSSNPPVDPEHKAAPSQEVASSQPAAKKGPGRPRKNAGANAGGTTKGAAAKTDVAAAQGAKRGKKATGQ
ncbi:hypothetical protein FRC06_008562, partial [Ceratobasidium sp. 370]